MSGEPLTTQEFGKNFVPSHVMEVCQEPCYISEIARKLQDTELTMIGGSDGAIIQYKDISLDEIIRSVSKILNGLEEGERVRLYEVGYNEGGGQEEASPLADEEDADDDETWFPYTLVEATEEVDISEEIQKRIDTSISVEEKIDMIEHMSSIGNEISKLVEEVFQDVLERQFRYYDDVQIPSYSDSGVDFYVNDEDQVDYGICYEVSTRFSNPIGLSYMQSKDDKAVEKDSDLVVMAPGFTRSSESKYQGEDDIDWRENPLIRSVELKELPSDKPYSYRPFPSSSKEDPDSSSSGTVVVIPDSKRSRELFGDSDHVSDSYPIFDSSYNRYREILDHVYREYELITESELRLQIRENIETSLWRLMNPYRVEQFLIDMYWDTGLRGGYLPPQDYIGRLVDRSGSTIGEWMRKNRWDIVTRGGGEKITESKVNIWEKMYKGEYPFPEEFSGYRIQAEYNRFPQFDIDDWENWYQSKSKEERQEIMTFRDSYNDNISYTIMMDNSERLLPSYSLVIQRLKDEGVEIRPADIAPRGLYNAYGSAKTIEYMINRDSSTVATDTGGSGVMGSEEAEVFDSYLEVDIATWLSENEVPYAHEPFTVPSMYSSGRDLYDMVISMVRQNGRGNVSQYRNIQEDINEGGLDVRTNIQDEDGNDVMLSELSPFEMRDEWNAIYDKHRLSEEQISPEVVDSLSRFSKQYILPDLVLYRNSDNKTVSQEWDGWDEWTEIVEVGGLWSVGIPEDADDEEWWTWYRVNSVAFKEFIYKLLGLWDDTYFLIPLETPIEGVSQGTPNAILRDDNYITFTSTQAEIDLGDFADELGLFGETVSSALSPPIQGVRYNRDLIDEEISKDLVSYSGIDMSRVRTYDRTYKASDEFVVYAGELGELYLDGENAYVKESQFKHDSVVMVREYVADSLIKLYDEDVLEYIDGV
jgi:hypothetical protein